MQPVQNVGISLDGLTEAPGKASQTDSCKLSKGLWDNCKHCIEDIGWNCLGLQPGKMMVADCDMLWVLKEEVMPNTIPMFN